MVRAHNEEAAERSYRAGETSEVRAALGFEDKSDAAERTELVERLARPEAILYRTDLERLGYERRAVDAIFRELPVLVLPGYSRPMIRATDYFALLERATYNEDKVRGR